MFKKVCTSPAKVADEVLHLSLQLLPIKPRKRLYKSRRSHRRGPAARLCRWQSLPLESPIPSTSPAKLIIAFELPPHGHRFPSHRLRHDWGNKFLQSLAKFSDKYDEYSKKWGGGITCFHYHNSDFAVIDDHQGLNCNFWDLVSEGFKLEGAIGLRAPVFPSCPVDRSKFKQKTNGDGNSAMVTTDRMKGRLRENPNQRREAGRGSATDGRGLTEFLAVGFPAKGGHRRRACGSENSVFDFRKREHDAPW
ncbi:hypothetical protein LXL04_021258 [Taraxacum kok-saghyz]